MKKETQYKPQQESTDNITTEIKDSLHNELQNTEKNIKKEILNNSNAMAIIIGATIIASAILIGLYAFGNNSSYKKDFIDPDSIYSGKEFTKEEFLNGSGNKKVVLLEYSDLECPFCKKLHAETMPEIYKNYGNDIDIVFRHFPLPFHQKAKSEAVAALCARDLGGTLAYKKYISEIFKTTQGNDSLDPNDLPKIAETLSLDKQKFITCITDPVSIENKMNIINSDLEDGAILGVNGTPSVFVLIKEGQEYRILTNISGARDYTYFSKVIDQALKQ